MDFQHLTVQAIAVELGNKDLLIIELRGRLEAIMGIPGVKESIEAHEAFQRAAVGNGLAPPGSEMKQAVVQEPEPELREQP